MALSVSDFDFPLPAERIAQRPCEPRDASRLMVLDRSTGRREHRIFHDLPQLLRPGDLLIVNDTRVIPARFHCRRGTGGRIEGLFLREVRLGEWEVMLGGAGRCRTGENLAIENLADAKLTLKERVSGSTYAVSVEPLSPALELLARVGVVPLPPYIQRSDSPAPADSQSYQTVYAANAGAVAAPTAGLHFTPELLEALRQRGIERASVTLHVGMGTFAPVKVKQVEQHTMHAEWYDLPEATAEAVNAARAAGRRIIAVGTTSVRVLESAARAAITLTPPSPVNGEGLQARPETMPLRAARGWTDIFIHPPARFTVVDGLVTNFHLPRSTLLMLVAAFCSPGSVGGVPIILEAYADAIRSGYRFYSYGDAMLIV